MPSGDGWLNAVLDYPAELDGLDLFESKPTGYHDFRHIDLDMGLPDDLPRYDAIVSCEGLEHIGNPGLFLTTARQHLKPNGILMITTPNIWHPQAKLQYIWRGFVPSSPSLVGRIERGSHMHIMPWSFPQLYLYLKLFGYTDVILYDVDERKPKHLYEKIVGLPQHWYCHAKLRASNTVEEQQFWRSASSPQSLYGRHLVVSARLQV